MYLFVDVRFGIMDGYYSDDEDNSEPMCGQDAKWAEEMRLRLNEKFPGSRFVTTKTKKPDGGDNCIGDFCMANSLRSSTDEANHELRMSIWKRVQDRVSAPFLDRLAVAESSSDALLSVVATLYANAFFEAGIQKPMASHLHTQLRCFVMDMLCKAIKDRDVIASDHSEPVGLGDLLDDSRPLQIIPHNTMRFDVQLAYIQPMIADGDVSKEVLVNAIRESIICAVDKTCGSGLDGVGVRHDVFPDADSGMFHRELIAFDFS